MARKILGVTTDDIATTDLPHTDFEYEGTEAEAFENQTEGTDNPFSPRLILNHQLRTLQIPQSPRLT